MIKGAVRKSHFLTAPFGIMLRGVCEEMKFGVHSVAEIPGTARVFSTIF